MKFDNTYSQLPENFFQKTLPSSATNPKLIAFNKDLANEMGLELENMNEQDLALIFSGMKILNGSEPLAMAYAGHQFGNFVPMLGDGRAILLGEILTPENKRFDIQLKGSGPTAFSRRGDGLSSLGPVIREYIVSEAMARLRIPTTRALAAVTSGSNVLRQESMPGGIFTRVASSHIRVGTFEYFFAHQRIDDLKILADYTIHRHYSDIPDDKDKYLKFFQQAARRKLDLVAKWMGVGFIHGVMNTDNNTISGETIDFGPCAFMDSFVFNKVFSSIDRHGRYAYNNQSSIAIWNLSNLANCLIPLIGEDEQKSVEILKHEISLLPEYFADQWLKVMAKKFGIFTPTSNDIKLIQSFLEILANDHTDFTLSFRNLPQNIDVNTEFHRAWKERLESQSESQEEAFKLMNNTNPAIIPRNHQVEKAISLALKGDYSHFQKMLKAIERPFEDIQEFEEFTKAPAPDEIVYQTFCGT